VPVVTVIDHFTLSCLVSSQLFLFFFFFFFFFVSTSRPAQRQQTDPDQIAGHPSLWPALIVHIKKEATFVLLCRIVS
jgi:hypothetical protein